jgi:hypothetical protein
MAQQVWYRVVRKNTKGKWKNTAWGSEDTNNDLPRLTFSEAIDAIKAARLFWPNENYRIARITQTIELVVDESAEE